MQAKDNSGTRETQPLLSYRGWGYSPPVDTKVLNTIAATGFTVAFLHAAIPTHWLPFVLTARVQKWSKTKTLAITTLAGCGHVLFTALLGFLIAWCGIKLSDKIGGWFPWIAGGALIAFGLFYVVQQIRGKGHGHSHGAGGHAQDHSEAQHGPRDGLLVDTGHGLVEITVFETGVTPQSRQREASRIAKSWLKPISTRASGWASRSAGSAIGMACRRMDS